MFIEYFLINLTTYKKSKKKIFLSIHYFFPNFLKKSAESNLTWLPLLLED